MGCASESELGDHSDAEGTDGANAIVQGQPDDRQIPATLNAAVDVMSESTGAATKLCSLAQGAKVDVARFEKGQYRIYLPGRKPCNAAMADSYRGWVKAETVVIADDAYPKNALRRVNANSGIDVSMNYAGNRGFCMPGKGCRINESLYGMNRCYVHPAVFDRIQVAAAKLKARLPGAKVSMLDCYRPVYVQKRMASIVNDPIWVAQPSPPRYGGHNGGIAIDVTIVGADGKPLDMGSDFDEFSPRSKFEAMPAGSLARRNRELLRSVMTEAGLSPYSEEWWHFSLAIDTRPLDLAL